jgi:hypothetical protein
MERKATREIAKMQIFMPESTSTAFALGNNATRFGNARLKFCSRSPKITATSTLVPPDSQSGETQIVVGDQANVSPAERPVKQTSEERGD